MVVLISVSCAATSASVVSRGSWLVGPACVASMGQLGRAKDDHWIYSRCSTARSWRWRAPTTPCRASRSASTDDAVSRCSIGEHTAKERKGSAKRASLAKCMLERCRCFGRGGIGRWVRVAYKRWDEDKSSSLTTTRREPYIRYSGQLLRLMSRLEVIASPSASGRSAEPHGHDAAREANRRQ